MDNSPEFTAAAASAKAFTKRPTDQELLELYGFYKQATMGDCSTDRPGMLDLKGKAKWDSWNGRKGMSREEAAKKYIALVATLSGMYK